MLTDTKLRNLKPKEKLYKVNDRDGLYVAVTPAGSVSFLLFGTEIFVYPTAKERVVFPFPFYSKISFRVLVLQFYLFHGAPRFL